MVVGLTIIWPSVAHGQDIVWTGPHPITGDQDVLSDGATVGAWYFDIGPPLQTVNGIQFYPANWVSPAPWPNANTYPHSQVTLGTASFPTSATHVIEQNEASSSAPYTLLSAGYQQVLSSGVGVSGGTLVLTLTGLVPGQQYAIETWANNSNANNGYAAGNITETLSGSVGTVLQTNPTGQEGQLGQYAIGTFTAPANGIESFAIDGSSSFFNDERSLINAVFVETLPVAVPEPATWAAAMLAIASLFSVRRRIRKS